MFLCALKRIMFYHALPSNEMNNYIASNIIGYSLIQKQTRAAGPAVSLSFKSTRTISTPAVSEHLHNNN